MAPPPMQAPQPVAQQPMPAAVPNGNGHPPTAAAPDGSGVPMYAQPLGAMPVAR